MLAILAISLIFVAVTALLAALAAPRARAALRLDDIGLYGYDAQPADAALPTVPRTSLVRLLTEVVGRPLAARTKTVERLRKDIRAAGIEGLTPRAVLGRQALAAAGGVFAGIAIDPLPILSGPVLDTALIGMFGWITPATLLRSRGRQRLEKIDRALPDFIDLVIVCMEAGQSFGAALVKAAESAEGPLGVELRRTLQEQQFGLPVDEALENLAERADTPNVRTFVRGVVQGERLGVSIGQVMRGIGHDMRLRRRQMAEERAQKTTIKILFPLVFLILPSLMIVALGPAVMRVLDTFS